MRTLVPVLWALGAAVAVAQETQVPDAGAAPPTEVAPAANAPAPPAPTPAPPAPPPAAGFDVVQTPWGPGRKSSGEKFSSAALAATEGPLRWRWSDFSLAVGGQYFLRGDGRSDADFNGATPDHAFNVEHRARVSVRASALERVGVLLEFQDVRGFGTETNTVTVMPNTGLHQGFVDLRVTDWLDVRAGRQELSYGEDRLIGNLDWAQASRAFDGLFLRVTASRSVTLDAFGMVLKPPAFVTPDSGGPRFHVSGSYFAGLYARARLGKAGFDVYGLGLLEDPSTSATGMRRDNNRATLGARGFGALGPVALVGEAAFQTGKVGQAAETVLAGAFAGRATWTLPVFGTPYVMAEFSGASGDGTPGDGTESTFHQLFPTGHVHLGFADYVGWQNVVAARGTIGWKPWGAHVWLDVHHLRAWDPRGAWYNAAGAVLLAADPTRTGSAMGTEVDLSLTVPVTAYLSIAGAFTLFVPGDMAASRGTTPSTWSFLYLRAQL